MKIFEASEDMDHIYRKYKKALRRISWAFSLDEDTPATLQINSKHMDPIYKIVLRRISRTLSLGEEFACLDQVPIAALDDPTLLHIFQFLTLPDLIRASEVCKRWYQLSFDRLLWKKVDLSDFAKPLHDKANLVDIAHSYLANKVTTLNIGGCTLPQEVITTLSLYCGGLRKLVVKSATFTIDENDDQVIFPDRLEYLDVRYSDGPAIIYQAIAKRLENIKWLGMCDALVLAMSYQQTPPLSNLVKLDMSHCKLVKDTFIKKLTSCKNIRLLNLRKCINISGQFLAVLLACSSGLETLILDGTSVQDEYLQEVDWKNTNIKYLEIGWCPLITTEGLRVFLPDIGRIQTLEYLGLCNVGQGQALTDYNLKQLGLRLQQGSCPQLHSLNLSFSHKITNYGVAAFQRMYCIETLDVTNCARVTLKEDDVMFEPPFKPSAVEPCDDNCVNVPRTRTSRGSFSTIQFALSDYTLETPL